MKRLYVVTITRKAYVFAEDEAAAREQCRQIEKWEEPTVECVVWRQQELDGWDDSCCVYADGPRDVLLEEAKRISRTNSA